MRLRNEQYMAIARMATEHADCKGTHVGAVLVLPNGATIIGANGSPVGHTRCEDGGCYRCSHREAFPPGTGYDVCTCVHAEGDCLAAAAEHGIRVKGATVYSTRRPCRECTKNMLQAGVHAVYYEEELVPSHPDELAAYLDLQRLFPGGVRRLITLTVPAVVGSTTVVRVEVPLN